MEPAGLRDLIASLLPGSRVVAVEPLAPDVSARDSTSKAAGYGAPLRITVADSEGEEQLLVFRTATANDFGHDRRADRAEQMLLSYDTFGRIPRHVPALDVGAIRADGRLISVADCGEFYLLTAFVPGQLYAEDLRRIAREEAALPRDIERCEILASYLVSLHAERGGRRAAYARAVRDLVGHGEGIFGIVDGYPQDVPAASLERLRGIEGRAWEWRWRLRDRPRRLARIHGDFHPFNVLFDEHGSLALLDTSRGSLGDPADDVVCMAINYVLFSLDRAGAWPRGLGVLWRTFWGAYLAESGDEELLETAAPYLAWRALVLACPVWYPSMSPAGRDRLLGFAERALEAPRFDPTWANDLFR